MTGGHGHVTPRPDGAKARCGGPALCSVCAGELAQGSPSGSPGISGETPGVHGLSVDLRAANREALGALVREAWVRWAREQPDAKPSWLAAWEDLDAGQREVDMRIGEAVATAERAKLQPAIDRVQRLATAAQAKAIEYAVAGERERCAVLAEARMATYDLTKPCGCGRTSPYTGRPCTALIRSGQPFADLIRESTDDT